MNLLFTINVQKFYLIYSNLYKMREITRVVKRMLKNEKRESVWERKREKEKEKERKLVGKAKEVVSL